MQECLAHWTTLRAYTQEDSSQTLGHFAASPQRNEQQSIRRSHGKFGTENVWKYSFRPRWRAYSAPRYCCFIIC